MLNMNPTGNPDQYSAAIPAPGHASQVEYYLRVVDSLGLAAALPLDAPTHAFLFYAGPDTILPVIMHTPLIDLPAITWPPTISATITDNLGVDSAWVIFQVNAQEPISVALAEVDPVDTWQGQLTGTVAIGDTVRYRIKAKDASNGGNIAYLPPIAQPQIAFVILGINAYTYPRSGFPINDYPGAARMDTFSIAEYFEIFEADVFVDIDHPDISELYFYIQSPQGTRVVLHNRTGSGDSLVGWYDDDFAPDGPGNMAQLVGQQAHGRWTFFISDRVAGNTGVVNGWVLRLAFPGSVGVEESNEAIPRAFALENNYPNPFNPSTVINFNLPAERHVRLEVYDLLGRVVRTLVDGDLPAGRHQVEWDGRSSFGERTSSGIYFARLTAGGEQAVIRMSLVK
jgi:subtilisin-like proprotein convertase family protein